MIDLVKKLCALPGVSGNETPVANFIKELITPYVDEVRIDRLGSVIAFKKGRQPAKNRVMLDAHMDEVGFMITGIEDNGYLRFITIGGIDTGVIVGRRVRVGDEQILGVIGTKPVHLQSAADRKSLPEVDSLFIDIGAKDKASAERHVRVADTAVFESDFVEYGEGFIKSRALDDRIGCAAMIEMIKKEQPYDLWYSFSVQEEIGGGGAKATTFAIDPAYAIVLEGTTAADFGDVPDEKQACNLGRGPVVTYMDRGTLYNPALYKEVMSVAAQKQIPAQPKRLVAGGNNAGSIHSMREGVNTVAISLPCRYIHSASCVMKAEDYQNTIRLVEAVAERFCEKE